ncbi:hypothetical protein FQA47_009432 [Oryzias melastigma]|uniref:Uncharacterized protein n=1 Tax=Oryzias melastigma TaxID=30732 RepID=A0A834CJF0_ORYME|nr:hypothetical protein FQA47_009432 [Oryzias melastigma]
MTQDPHSLADLATQFPPLPAPIAKNHQRRQPQRIEPMRKSSIPPGDFSPSSFTDAEDARNDTPEVRTLDAGARVSPSTVADEEEVAYAAREGGRGGREGGDPEERKRRERRRERETGCNYEQ